MGQYDPATGRFLSLDPLAPQDYASPYAYVANNPLAFIDPSGARRHACSGLGCLRRWASDPNNLWDSIRYSGAAAACYDGGEVGARAGILGAAIGCLAVTTAFDISAEHAREKIHDLGGD